MCVLFCFSLTLFIFIFCFFVCHRYAAIQLLACVLKKIKIKKSLLCYLSHLLIIHYGKIYFSKKWNPHPFFFSSFLRVNFFLQTKKMYENNTFYFYFYVSLFFSSPFKNKKKNGLLFTNSKIKK